MAGNMERKLWKCAVALLAAAAMGCSGPKGVPVEGAPGAVGAKISESAQSSGMEEWFSYTCPHCAAMEESMEKRLSAGDLDKIELHPAVFGSPASAAAAKLYFAAKFSGGWNRQVHKKLFEAVSSGRVNPADTESARALLTETLGASKGAAAAAYMGSPEAEAQARQAREMMKSRKIDLVPQFVWKGQWSLSAPSSGGPEKALEGAALILRSGQ